MSKDNNLEKRVNEFLSKYKINPVLIDIGASGDTPSIWKDIEKNSIYIGFDPDLREICEVPKGRFYKAIMVNEAVVSNDNVKSITFYLTKSPYCSSILKPDTKALSNHIFFDLFKIEKEERVRAATLNNILKSLSIDHIDWFKVDSQGTDLRLFNSLNEKIRSRVLAVDLEPGLIDAYIGEDLFIDVHKDLTSNGFWLSNMDVRGTIRMKLSTLNSLNKDNKKLNYENVYKNIRESPCWCEVLYLRTLEWAEENDYNKDEYIKLWIFSLVDKQIGFSLDLIRQYEKIFGKDEISIKMNQVSLSFIKIDKMKDLKSWVYSTLKWPYRLIRGTS